MVSMALEEKYQTLFEQECFKLSEIVLDKLKRLEINPDDTKAMEDMLQSADIIIGDSRFINNYELEKTASLMIKTFNGKKSASGKAKELRYFMEFFSKFLKY